MFFGTPAWAVPSLEALLGAPGVEVAAVVTNPDRPAGRGMELRPSPVKQRALEAGIEVWQPDRASAPDLARALAAAAPEVCVVVAYGRILPSALLELPPKGFVNLHFSLLPRWRGAAPVQRAIIAGDEVTGVSVMVLTEGLDEGPVLATEEVDIAPEDTAGSLGERLAEAGAALLLKTLPAYVAGELTPVEQDHSQATYAPKLTTEEARIDWSLPARRIRDLVRGLNPAPGAWTTLRGQRLKIFEVIEDKGAPPLAPGELRLAGGLVAGTGDAPVVIVDAQLATKRRLAGPELARGLRVIEGERLV